MISKKRIPYCHAKSIYEIDMNFYHSHNFKYVFIDLDNTLDSYKQKEPTDKAIDLFENFKNNGINAIIVSNNKQKRVSRYAGCLNAEYLYSIGKPFPSKFKKYLKSKNIDPTICVLIGDQTTTDVPFANGANIKAILTDKIVKEDQITTRFNRLFDNCFRRKIEKNNLLVDWREI